MANLLRMSSEDMGAFLDKHEIRCIRCVPKAIIFRGGPLGSADTSNARKQYFRINAVVI